MVRLDNIEIGLDIERNGEGIAIRFLGKGAKTVAARTLTSSWKPGDPVWTGSAGKDIIAVRVRPVSNGFVLSHRGVEARAFVYTESEAKAARMMPVKVAANEGKKLLCPMPGVVISIAVAPGQEVKTGETLAVVEAMKMENILRAERDGTVKTILAKPGDSLAVDAVMMEFA
jgi:propionyl-CoA carboxylase alpha chain